jgi:hypothetical protein
MGMGGHQAYTEEEKTQMLNDLKKAKGMPVEEDDTATNRKLVEAAQKKAIENETPEERKKRLQHEWYLNNKKSRYKNGKYQKKAEEKPKRKYTKRKQIPAAEEARPVERCEKCGCTDDRACPGGCSWVAPGKCSRCFEVKLLPDGNEIIEERHKGELGSSWFYNQPKSNSNSGGGVPDAGIVSFKSEGIFLEVRADVESLETAVSLLTLSLNHHKKLNGGR